MSAVSRSCAAVAALDFVERHQENAGFDRVPYVNFMFTTSEPARLWAALWEALFDDPLLGPDLARCAMTMCEGPNGWDDYLLLSHFDPDQSLDRFP